MRFRNYALLLGLVGLTAMALGQDIVKDIVENHWIFESLAKLKKEGLLVGYPPTARNRPTTSKEMVSQIVIATKNYMHLTDSPLSEVDAKEYGDLELPLVRLIVRFRTDLDRDGVGEDQLLKIISRTAQKLKSRRQFSDVPKGHWAAQAVLDLRRAGILVGYPNSSQFGGK